MPRTITDQGPALRLAVLAAVTAAIAYLFAMPPPAAAAIAIDKVVTKNQTTRSTTVTTAAFDTVQPGELLVAFVAADGPNATAGQRVTAMTGGGLQWTLRQRVNVQAGASEIWQAVAPTTLTGVTVRATLSASAVSSLTVLAASGADTTVNGAVGAANAPTGAPSVSLVATRNGSWVWGVGNDWDRATARTVGAGQTKVAEYLAPVGDTFWVQRRTTASGFTGTATTLNDTAPTTDRWNMAAIEILPAVVDTAAPTAPTGLTANATSPTTVELAWTASSDDVGVTGYRILRGGAQVGTSSATSFTDSTAVAGTSYTYRVRAVDASGNVSLDSQAAGVTTPSPDTTAPVLSAVAAGAITQTGATIGWTTDEASDSQVDYGTTAAYGSTTTLNPARVTSHSVTLGGLAPDTTLHYRVRSRDAAGNLAVSGDATFATSPAPPDASPPTTQVTSPADGATVSGQVSVAATASDDVGVVSVQFRLDGNALGAADTTAPYSVSWDTTSATNAGHLLTAIARDAAGNATTSATVSVTVANTTGTAPIALDGIVTTHGSSATTAITSPGLTTTSGGDVLVAFVTSDGPSGSGSQSFTSVTGGGLTWRLRQRTNTQAGTAEIWQAVAPLPLAGVTVTATRGNGAWQGAITVAAFKNASTTIDGATATGNASTGAPTAAVTTTRPGSWVWGVGDDYDRAIARTVGPGQTLVDQFLAPVGDTFWVQRQNAPTPAAGTVVTINATAPTTDRWNLSVIEIVAAQGPADSTPPTGSITAPSAGATVSGTVAVTAAAADDNGVYGVQFLLDGLPLGAEDRSAPYSAGWNTLGANNGTHQLSARVSDAAGNSTTTAAVTVTVANATSALSPTVDASTPGPRAVPNNVPTTTSPAFSPPSGTVLYAVFAMDSPAQPPITTVTSVTNTGTPLTWRLLGRENHSNGYSVGGFVEVWWAYNPTAQPGITATAAFSQPTKDVQPPVGDFQILVLNNAAADQSAAAWGANYILDTRNNAQSASVTTTGVNSAVLATFNNWDNSQMPVPGPDQRLLSVVLNDLDRVGYWVQAKNTPIASPSLVTMNSTTPGIASEWHGLAWEVLGLSN